MGSGGISPTPSPTTPPQSGGISPGTGFAPGRLQQLRFQELLGHPSPPAGLEVHRDGVFHEVQQGDTLRDIVAQYSEAYNTDDITRGSMLAANPSLRDDGMQPGSLLAMPKVEEFLDAGIRPGTRLHRLESLRSLDTDFVMTKVGRVRDESGRVSSLDVQYYRADTKHAKTYASTGDAIRAAKLALRHGESSSPTVAIMRTRDGGVSTVPLKGQEGQSLGDSTKTLSLTDRASTREMVGVVQDARGSRNATVRRFDR